jgi:hypothetical protein
MANNYPAKMYEWVINDSYRTASFSVSRGIELHSFPPKEVMGPLLWANSPHNRGHITWRLNIKTVELEVYDRYIEVVTIKFKRDCDLVQFKLQFT